MSGHEGAVIVTGAGSGIGAATVALLAARGARVVAVGRTPARVAAVAEPLGCPWHVVELGDLADVRRLAAVLVREHPRIAALVNNAGALFGGALLTGDGNEINMQINALGPLLLATALTSPLAGGRLITIGSRSHRWARLDPADLEVPARAGRSGASRYAAAKFAAAALTHEYAHRNPGVATAVVDPGIVATDLWRGSGVAGRLLRLPVPGLVRSPIRAARPICDLVLAPEPFPSGHHGSRIFGREAPRVRGAGIGAALWEAAMARLGSG